jgi:hypothetical protein
MDTTAAFEYILSRMNDLVNPQDELRDFIQIQPDEVYNDNGLLDNRPYDEQEEPYDGAGWPGDGSGTDDFQDYNANEADDYQNE